MLFVLLGIPIFLAGFVEQSNYSNFTWKDLWTGTYFAVWLFTITYSLAMTAQCLTRHPLYAAALTVTALMLGSFSWHKAEQNLEPSALVGTTSMIVALSVVVFLGWKTVKHDWGWKH